MVTGKVRKNLPPYVSYRTLWNFIDGLKQGMPARIDRSYWGDRLSGSTGTQLMAAVRFLGLIDGNGIPTSQLKQLVSVKGDQKTEILREITLKAFDFLFKGPFDLQAATYAQLEEAFHDTFELTRDVARKCIKFFLGLATEAAISLSPHIIKKTKMAHSSAGLRKITKKRGARTERNLPIPQTVEEIPIQQSWDKILLTKFPAFDPNWPNDVQLKWFAAFDELLKRGWNKGEK